jgi:GMP synthase (glutamine-hydrolysing)
VAKRVLTLQHVEENPVGLLGQLLHEYGIAYDVINVEQEPVPNPEHYDAVLAFGGTQHVYNEQDYSSFAAEIARIRQAVEQDIPFLGICLGGQLLAHALGASVQRHSMTEIGFFDVTFTPEGQRDPLYQGLPGYQTVFQWHEDAFELPDGAIHLATNANTRYQAFRYGKRAYGLQYHIELDPPMLDSWIHHPDMKKELISTLGLDAYTRLDQSSAQHYPTYCEHTRIMFANFLRIGGLI